MARGKSNGANVPCFEEYAVALTTWPSVTPRVTSIKATSNIAPTESPRRNKSRGGDDFHAVAHGEHTPPSPNGWNAPHLGACKLCDVAGRRDDGHQHLQAIHRERPVPRSQHDISTSGLRRVIEFARELKERMTHSAAWFTPRS
jgi:hypothetical protein